MAGGGGFVKAYRKLRQHPALQEDLQRSLFITLLWDAEVAEHVRASKWGKVLLQRGQCLVSLRALAAELKSSTSKIQRALAVLMEHGLIRTQTLTQNRTIGTLVTICNFDTFSGSIKLDRTIIHTQTSTTLRRQRTNRESPSVCVARERTRGAPGGATHTHQDDDLLPAGWQPSSETLEYGRELGLSDAEIDRGLQKMALHARERGLRANDWDARAQRWLITDVERSLRAAKSDPPIAQRPRDSRWNFPSTKDFAVKVAKHITGRDAAPELVGMLANSAHREGEAVTWKEVEYTPEDQLALYYTGQRAGSEQQTAGPRQAAGGS